jgi:hypothetical protein
MKNGQMLLLNERSYLFEVSVEYNRKESLTNVKNIGNCTYVVIAGTQC